MCKMPMYLMSAKHKTKQLKSSSSSGLDFVSQLTT